MTNLPQGKNVIRIYESDRKYFDICLSKCSFSFDNAFLPAPLLSFSGPLKITRPAVFLLFNQQSIPFPLIVFNVHIILCFFFLASYVLKSLRIPQICDRGLTLGDLIGTLEQFFRRLGLPKLRFKPAYNPYTEPSMEIFSYSEELDKWMEVGNSGMFRPEMLEPMGLPPDVTVIAWGLSLERCCPTQMNVIHCNMYHLFTGCCPRPLYAPL
jgi:hypothetical protein